MLSTRISQATLSFVLLLAGYACYASCVVPWLEPPAKTREPAHGAADHLAFESVASQFRDILEGLFPSGSWELQEAKILKTAQFLLLLKDYQTLPDGRIKIAPCTVVFRPHGFQDNSVGDYTWVLQAEEGAIISFDGPVDVRKSGFGKLQAGYLPGSVIITGTDPKNPDAPPMELTTRGIQISPARIFTPHEVHFRMGKSFGTGRDLSILLSADEAGELRRLPSDFVSQVKSIELVELQQLVLAPPDQLAAEAWIGSGTSPWQIRCAGPFTLDVERSTARLSQQVVISRATERGTLDRLQCDRFSIWFRRDQESPSSGDTVHDRPPIEIVRVLAEGKPARFVTSSVAASAASSEPPRWHELTGPQLEYVVDAASQTPWLQAAGPGRYETGTAGQEGDRFHAAWTDALRWKPDGQQSEISLLGDVICEAGRFGRLAAGSLRIWLRGQRVAMAPQAGRPSDVPPAEERAGGAPEEPEGPALGNLQPERLLAEQNVQFSQVQLIGHTQRLDVVFEVPSAATTPTAVSTGTPFDGSGQASSLHPNGALRVGSDQITARLGRRGASYLLRELQLEGCVRCQQLAATHGTGPAHFQLEGQSLALTEFADDGGVAVLCGTPGVIRTAGLELLGEKIHLDRGHNRLWIDGPGSATVPLPEEMASSYPPHLAYARVSWQRELRFDGRKARCEGAVEVRGPAQLLRTSALSASLATPIDLRAEPRRLQLAVDQIQAESDVWLENRAFDSRGLVSVDTGLVKNFQYDYPTGRLAAAGPGWVRSVRLGDGQPAALGMLPGPTPRSPDEPPQLVFLEVEFQQGMDGSTDTRQLNFLHQVRCLYGPVDDWDDTIRVDPLQSLPEQAVTMECQQLSVLQMPGAHRRPSLEFIAIGHTVIEGRSFAARADRLSYDQEKDLLVLQGDPRSDAELWYQRQMGTARSRAAARQIHFRPASNRVKLIDALSLELNASELLP